MIMNWQKIKKYVIGILIYLVIAAAFQWIAGDQLKYKIRTSEVTEVNNTVGELTEGTVVKQEFTSKTDSIQTVRLYFSAYGRQNTGVVEVTIKTAEDEMVLFQTQLDAATLKDEWQEIIVDSTDQNLQDKKLVMEITGTSPAGAAPSLYYNDYINEDSCLMINGQEIAGSLGYEIEGRIYYALGEYYWQIAAALGILILFYSAYLQYCSRIGKKNWILIFKGVYTRYRFLIEQLVSRDFKTKYKRSVLGYLWSFLNPLMTMGVQYVVFSTIFKSGIENFPVYLLSGVVFFNFFTEAVGLGLTSIIGNSALITKVYMPKYIYPVTRVLSSTINLLISLIPLFLLTLLTGTGLTSKVVLLVIPVVSILVFCIGMAMALSASMVFFRDTQYLWGIVSMAWMYLTPLFYPIEILPEQFKIVLNCNPLYHIIDFVRVILIYGQSPEPIEYIYCLGMSFAVLVIGAWIFKKNQDKFVLYI